MVIDIINYTEEQLAALSPTKLQEVREAQVRKNRLLNALAAEIAQEKQRLLDRGVFSSTIWEKRSAELTASCNAEIEIIKESLNFYLHYVSTEEGGTATPDVPYDVDYALTEEERMVAVRNYYTSAYTDAAVRFEAFAADEFARVYLGEMYAPLYHYFLDLA